MFYLQLEYTVTSLNLLIFFMFLPQISVLQLITTKIFWEVNYYGKFMPTEFGWPYHVDQF